MNKIGITFDEKMFENKYLEGLEKLIELGFEHIELTLHPALLPIPIYKEILQKMAFHKIDCSFHIPNFIKDANMVVDDFQIGGQCQRAFEMQLENVNQLYTHAFDNGVKSNYVLHGLERVTAESRNLKSTRDDLLIFLDFICNYIEKRSLKLYPLLENTYNDSNSLYPASSKELNPTMEKLADYPLGICVDMAHLMGAQDALKNISNKNAIGQFHVHGFKSNPYQSHFPLCHDKEQARRQIDMIRSENVEGVPIILEILGYDKGLYVEKCGEDLEMITKILA